MSKNAENKWLDQPVAHNYPSALSSLSLIFEGGTAAADVAQLKRAALSEFKTR